MSGIRSESLGEWLADAFTVRHSIAEQSYPDAVDLSASQVSEQDMSLNTLALLATAPFLLGVGLEPASHGVPHASGSNHSNDDGMNANKQAEREGAIKFEGIESTVGREVRCHQGRPATGPIKWRPSTAGP